MQASHETTSVGSQTEYQLLDKRGNKNLSYSSIMAEYVSLTITFSISKSIKQKRVRFHSAISSLYVLSITICLVMIKLLHVHYFIMQVLFKISSKIYSYNLSFL